jgi:hypothetical protein
MTPNKLLVALVASTFSFGSVGAMADDKTPAQPVDQAKPKADTDAAKANAKAMTREEEVAAKKAKRAAEREEAFSRAQRPWTVEGAHRVDRELSTTTKIDIDAAKAAKAKERTAKRLAEIDAKEKAGAANKPTN